MGDLSFLVDDDIPKDEEIAVSFPKKLLPLGCPVTGCLGGASSRTNLWIHFAHLRMQDTIGILEEGNRLYPRCPQCNIFVPQKSLDG